MNCSWHFASWKGRLASATGEGFCACQLTWWKLQTAADALGWLQLLTALCSFICKVWGLLCSCDLSVPVCPMPPINSALDGSSTKELKNKNKCQWWISWSVWFTEVETQQQLNLQILICFGYKISYVNRHMLTVHRVICVSLFDVRNSATIFKERNWEVRWFFFLFHKGCFTNAANLSVAEEGLSLKPGETPSLPENRSST